MTDLILENKLILLSLAASLLPMVFSVLIVISVVLANAINARAERKRLERLRAHRLAIKREEMRLLRAREATDQAIAALGGGTPAEESADAEADAPQDEENETDSAIQSILSSVFADEDENTQYDILLKDRAPVDIHALRVLAEQIRAGLGEAV